MKKELVYNLLLAALLTFTSTLMLMHIFIQVSEMLVSPIEPRFIEMCHSLFAAWNTRPPPFSPFRYRRPLVLCCKESMVVLEYIYNTHVDI